MKKLILPERKLFVPTRRKLLTGAAAMIAAPFVLSGARAAPAGGDMLSMTGAGGSARQPAAAGGEPDSVAGGVLWLRADSLTYSDNDGVTTPVSAHNAVVGSWDNKFAPGVGGHWTAHDTGNKPTIEIGIHGTQTVIHIGGAAAKPMNGRDYSALTAGEVFVVYACVNTPASCFSFGSGAAQDDYQPFNDNDFYDNFGSSARKTAGDPGVDPTTFRLYNIVSTSSEWTAFINGTQLFTTGTNTVGFRADPRFSRSVASGTGANWYCADFILYDHKLSGPDKTTIKTYVATRYGLTIA